MDSVEKRRILGCEPRVPQGRPFSMIRNVTMEKIARDRSIPRVEIVTLLLLSAYADDEGVVVGTLDQIAEMIGYGRGITAEALRKLVAAGYLVKVKRAVYRVTPKVCTPAAPWARAA